MSAALSRPDTWLHPTDAAAPFSPLLQRGRSTHAILATKRNVCERSLLGLLGFGFSIINSMNCLIVFI